MTTLEEAHRPPARPTRTSVARQPRLPAGRRVLLATVPCDAHMWNLVFLQLLMEEHGHEVHNLGHCTPVELVVQRAVALRPDAIVVSTVNGHGQLDARRLAKALRERPELAGTRLILGGKLGVQGQLAAATADHLVQLGFDVVIEASTTPRPLDRLAEELGLSGGPDLLEVEGVA